MNTERIKFSRLDWTIIFFLCFSFFISQSASFFKDVYSDAPMYAQMNGVVEWWVRMLSWKVQLVWIMLFAVVLGLSKERLNAKQACMIAAYGFSLYKDIYDWFANNNQGTKYIDWIVTILLFGFVQALFWSVKKFRT